MKIGLNLWIWDSPFRTADHLALFDKTRALGGEVVEIALEAAAVIDAPAVRRALDGNGLGCSLVGLFGPPRDLSLGGAARQAGLDYSRRAIDLCAEMGAAVFSGAMIGVGGSELLSAAERETRYQRTAEGLRQLGDYGAERNVQVVIEVLNRYECNFLNTAAEARDLNALTAHPNVGIHLDTFHMGIEETDLAQALHTAGAGLRHFHASDSHRGAPGDGLLPWGQVAQGLRDIHYTGFVVIESFHYLSPLGPLARFWRPLAASPDDLASRGLQFLKRTLRG